jgi:hypothetical protein
MKSTLLGVFFDWILVIPFRAVCRTAHYICIPGQSIHRNLSTRTSKFALVQQTFLAKKILVKSLLISTLDKAIFYKGTFLQGSTKPLFTTQNRFETSWKMLFFNMLLLHSTKISMGQSMQRRKNGVMLSLVFISNFSSQNLWRKSRFYFSGICILSNCKNALIPPTLNQT